MDKPFFENKSEIKALDKPKRPSDMPMKASNKVVRPSEVPTKGSDKLIKTPNSLKRESKTGVKHLPGRSPATTVKEKQEYQVTNVDDMSDTTRISTSLFHDTSVQESLSFVCISDTHCKLTQEIISAIPHGDVLLHAGDFTMNGTVRELIEFNKFLGTLSHTYKVVIAGNHEDCLEDDMSPETSFIDKHLRQKYGVNKIRELLTNCIYLQDELTEICGIKIYGSPWTQQYSSCNAFALSSSESLQRRWDKVPADIDILMTHGPPRGLGDTTSKQVSAGCSDLLRAVKNRIKPRYHVFGHIHEGYGVYINETTTFINAATCTRGYKPTNHPIKFRLNIPRSSTCDIDCEDCSNQNVCTDFINHCDVNNYDSTKQVKCDSTGLVNCDSTKVLNCNITKIGNCDSTKLDNYYSTRLVNCDSTKLVNCDSTKLVNCDSTRLVNCDSTKLVNCDSTKLVYCDSTRPVNCDSTKLVNCDSTRLVNCDSTKLINCDSTRLVNCDSTKLVICDSNCDSMKTI